jgi:hypothetical protein
MGFAMRFAEWGATTCVLNHWLTQNRLERPTEVRWNGSNHLEGPTEGHGGGWNHLEGPTEVRWRGSNHLERPTEVVWGGLGTENSREGFTCGLEKLLDPGFIAFGFE